MTLPTKVDEDRALIRRVGQEIGEDLVDYIEWMYPEMVLAARSWKSARISLRNSVSNRFVAAVKASENNDVEGFIKRGRDHRREMKRLRRQAEQAEADRKSKEIDV
jgi:hypothetical protein